MLLKNELNESDFKGRKIVLGIICAFGQEADLLISSIVDRKVYIINGKSFYIGFLNDVPVVIVLSGISIVNASMTTQLLIDHFKIQNILFSGIAGIVNKDYRLGDVIIPKNWINSDEIYFSNNEDVPSYSDQYGDISALGLKIDLNIMPYKNMFIRKNNIINNSNYSDVALTTNIDGDDIPILYGEMKASFKVDDKLLKIAEKAISNVLPDLEPIDEGKSTYKPKVRIGNNGISSGSFLANSNYREYLYQELKGCCVDMETAAVAHVAYSNEIPFIAFRSLSDLAGGEPHPNVAKFFSSGIAQRNAAKMTMEFIKCMGL